MDEKNDLAARFEGHRQHLRAVAFRMLGSASEAEDAVQEAWLRVAQADSSHVENLGGWLTTVTARICLDQLRGRKSRREEPEGDAVLDAASSRDGGTSPERDTLLADSVGLALLVVLETLTPAERLAFVLHDMFDLPFEEIAPIVGCSLPAARQLASRARRRVRSDDAVLEADPQVAPRRRIVNAFLVASRTGDLSGLLQLLDPDVVLRADAVAVEASQARQAQGAPVLLPEIRGADAVARTFRGRAQAARVALIDGVIGAAWAPDGQPRALIEFSIAGGKVVAIQMSADPDRIQSSEVILERLEINR